MALSYYITHPDVRIDPQVPVPLWGLSDVGRARAEAFAARDLLPHDAVILASGEIKAEELAEILAARHGNPIVTRTRLGENDRSATGFLPPKAFEQHVSRFFGAPDRSADGWETARDAQDRIVGAVREALAEFGADTPLVFAGHGGVGTLLKCFVANRAISQSEDQRTTGHRGGGNVMVFDLAARHLISDWTAMEDWVPDHD